MYSSPSTARVRPPCEFLKLKLEREDTIEGLLVIAKESAAELPS
jgi:hypothetical protein